ncbi:hypothetical protein ABZ342_35245 [Amycolatopsis sp. NPDC005961]
MELWQAYRSRWCGAWLLQPWSTGIPETRQPYATRDDHSSYSAD